MRKKGEGGREGGWGGKNREIIVLVTLSSCPIKLEMAKCQENERHVQYTIKDYLLKICPQQRWMYYFYLFIYLFSSLIYIMGCISLTVIVS